MELDEERMRKKKKELPSPADPGGLFSLLDDDVQSIVKPFLTTKFCVSKGQAKPSDAAGGLDETSAGWSKKAHKADASRFVPLLLCWNHQQKLFAIGSAYW